MLVYLKNHAAFESKIENRVSLNNYIYLNYRKVCEILHSYSYLALIPMQIEKGLNYIQQL